MLPPPIPTLFPYTTLFRSRFRPVPRSENQGSAAGGRAGRGAGQGRRQGRPVAWPGDPADRQGNARSEEHTSELQSLRHLVCRLLLEKKKNEQTEHSRNETN